MMFILSLLVIVCSIATSTCLNTCLGTNENNRFSNIRSQIRVFEQNINALENGLKEKRLHPRRGCPTNWQRYRNHCYFFSDDKKNWFEAERFCRTQGSSLVYIDDKAENDWVFEKTQEPQRAYDRNWIGVTDAELGEWIYSHDFSPVRYSDWNSGEPNNQHNENCGEIWQPDGNFTGIWNDLRCDLLSFYVCKKSEIGSCLDNQVSLS